jgi:hypothetical protein
VLNLLFARQNGLQGVAGLGNLGEVDFRAELFSTRAVTFVRAAHFVKVLAYLLGLIGLHGAGVGLLLRYADFNQHVENLFAFDFQLASQIVDSNLHPPFVPLCRWLLLCGTAGLRRSAMLLDWIVFRLRRHPCCVCLDEPHGSPRKSATQRTAREAWRAVNFAAPGVLTVLWAALLFLSFRFSSSFRFVLRRGLWRRVGLFAG